MIPPSIAAFYSSSTWQYVVVSSSAAAAACSKSPYIYCDEYHHAVFDSKSPGPGTPPSSLFLVLMLRH